MKAVKEEKKQDKEEKVEDQKEGPQLIQTLNTCIHNIYSPITFNHLFFITSIIYYLHHYQNSIKMLRQKFS